tara:strand:- start:1213 stop:2142 length:930 start_codon:yes stop_codon:yes gene_type:complete
MGVEFPTADAECNTYGYTFDSNCTGADGKTLDYDQTWHAVVLNGVTAWIPLSSPTISGTDGTDGAQGNDGFQGNNGPQGNDGPQGDSGVQGTNATDGTPGAEGNQGRQGPEVRSASLKSKDINVLETMFVESIDGNTFTVSSTDSLTYDPSNLGALKIKRLREDIGTEPVFNNDADLILRGICGPSQFVNFTASTPTKIILDDTSASDGYGTWSRWMAGDFMTVIIKQPTSDPPNNSWGQTGQDNQKFYRLDGTQYGSDEVRISGGRTGSFGRSLGDIDILYISCINEPSQTAIKPYFIVNHVPFHATE